MKECECLCEGHFSSQLSHTLTSDNALSEVWTWSESRRRDKLWYFDGLRRCCLNLLKNEKDK